MTIACFCGLTYQSDDPIAQCPTCGEPTLAPSLTIRDIAEMACDVAEIIAEHEGKPVA